MSASKLASSKAASGKAAADRSGPNQAVAHGPASHPTAPSKPAAGKWPKAQRAADCVVLEQLPNIGPALARDLRLIGIQRPGDLRGKDAFVMYQKLCALTGQRHDPCLLDTFMAATDFMSGAAPAPWWSYTAQRKALFGQV